MCGRTERCPTVPKLTVISAEKVSSGLTPPSVSKPFQPIALNSCKLILFCYLRTNNHTLKNIYIIYVLKAMVL
jgi:hypothetical protein